MDTPNPAAALRTGGGPDQGTAHGLVTRLYPDSDVVATDSCSLADAAGPRPDTVYVGCYPGVTVFCDAQLALPRPSRLAEGLIGPQACEHTYLVGLDSELGWGAFAHWQRGVLRRSFSATRINILEDEGLPLVWERPFWAREHPMGHEGGGLPDPQRLPFDPLHFAEAANLQWLGFRYQTPAYDSAVGNTPLDPGAIMLCGFARYPRGQAPAAGPGSSLASRASRPRRKWLRRFASAGSGVTSS